MKDELVFLAVDATNGKIHSLIRVSTKDVKRARDRMRQFLALCKEGDSVYVLPGDKVKP